MGRLAAPAIMALGGREMPQTGLSILHQSVLGEEEWLSGAQRLHLIDRNWFASRHPYTKFKMASP
ncbi:hypothetical protein [Parasphingopyxis algicola]|uniref:hypothetical protein n=1 Tax=Parasphingopyxis algicola TaxID=2026624 RepID=UPI001C40B01D|nr:hypothetical protein [Parasphingopyxis algicola]